VILYRSAAQAGRILPSSFHPYKRLDERTYCMPVSLMCSGWQSRSIHRWVSARSDLRLAALARIASKRHRNADVSTFGYPRRFQDLVQMTMQ